MDYKRHWQKVKTWRKSLWRCIQRFVLKPTLTWHKKTGASFWMTKSQLTLYWVLIVCHSEALKLLFLISRSSHWPPLTEVSQFRCQDILTDIFKIFLGLWFHSFFFYHYQGFGSPEQSVCWAGKPQQNASEHGPRSQGLGLWLQPPALHGWSKGHEDRYRGWVMQHWQKCIWLKDQFIQKKYIWKTKVACLCINNVLVTQRHFYQLQR